MSKKDPRGYLEDLLTHADRILEFTREGRDVFFASVMIQDAVLRNFEVIGEIVKRLDKAFTEQHPHIPWRQMAAFRDVIIHDYENIYLETVWKTVSDDLPTLRANIAALGEALGAEDEDNDD
jgi:uncharacterized protein with HEPN domain